MSLRSVLPTFGRCCYFALKKPPTAVSRRSFTFSFVGPKNLDDILKKELIEGKSSSEVSDIWYQYHETKPDVVGTIVSGEEGKNVLTRAKKCPFFIQPVFRDDGFFMLVSQYNEPNHFLMAYLEDYKMDPHSASPLLTFSVFTDLADDKDLSLIRGDILNKNLDTNEARKVVQSVVSNYSQDEGFGSVETFNKKPDAFDIDDYISRMNERWKKEVGETIDAS